METASANDGLADRRLRSVTSSAPSTTGASAETARKVGPQRGPSDGWLLVVSNREPYEHQRKDGKLTIEQPAGGLVSALDPVMKRLHGSWVAWGSGSADRETVGPDGSLMVPPDDPSYRLRRVWVPPEEQENFYLGYANQSLWPICHMLVDEAKFRSRFWDAYRSANRRFADAVLEEVEDDKRVVWVHDYHFALLPAMLRERRPELPISLFWHIPWPPYDVWRVNPQRRVLLESLIATDVLAFHVERYVQNFLDCVEGELGDEVHIDRTRGTVRQAEQVTRIRAIPISIDVEQLLTLAARPDAADRRAELEEQFGLRGRKLVLGVDRLDYTKGLPHKLKALEIFFERHPERRGEVTFVQIASPSRTAIGAYQRLETEVRERAHRLNERFATPEWKPVHLIERNTPTSDLVILYRMADACWVTSLYDGMNLVASEYVICADPRRGMLLLSEFTGASEFLDEAIHVNPYDPETSSIRLEEALELPVEERQRRLETMAQRIHRYTVHDWVEQNLNRMGPLKSGRLALSF